MESSAVDYHRNSQTGVIIRYYFAKASLYSAVPRLSTVDWTKIGPEIGDRKFDRR